MRLLGTIVILMMTFHTQMWSQETWVKTFGGSNEEFVGSVTRTPDNGFVLTGYTKSVDGDFEGLREGGDWDCFVIKLDQQGNVKWRRVLGIETYHGPSSSGVTTLTLDGGYLLKGITRRYVNDSTESQSWDVFVVKLTHTGDVQWRTNLGGSQDDGTKSTNIITTQDGGFVLTGYTNSKDGHFKEMKEGEGGIFVVKLDNNGKIRWNRRFGGSGRESGIEITETSDEGFILTGFTRSNDGDFEGVNKGESDVFVIKLDSNGNLQRKSK